MLLEGIIIRSFLAFFVVIHGLLSNNTAALLFSGQLINRHFSELRYEGGEPLVVSIFFSGSIGCQHYSLGVLD